MAFCLFGAFFCFLWSQGSSLQVQVQWQARGLNVQLCRCNTQATSTAFNVLLTLLISLQRQGLLVHAVVEFTGKPLRLHQTITELGILECPSLPPPV